MKPVDPKVSIAARIADGTKIDWHSPDSATSAIDDPDLVSNLQSIAALAALHRAPVDECGIGASGTSWGPLTIVGPIGQGRFGQVFRAWDSRLAREVALKILYAEASQAVALPSKAIEEARLLARVRHPNVLTVYGAECIDGRIGIWSELIEGQTLHQIVEERGPLPAEEVASIGIDICRALAAVHDAGFVHRDVKAQNVMREVGGRIVLMDFGTVHDTAIVPAGAAGTPLYMAPELVGGGTASVAGDIYAVAVLLFRLLTGQFPVDGATVDAVQQAHAQGRRRLLRDVVADVPAPLATTIERGLAADPTDRFGRAEEFAEALRSSLPATGAAARQSSVSRLRWMAAAGVTATAAGLAIWFLPASETADGVPTLICRNCIAQLSSLSRDGRTAIVQDDQTGDLAVRDLRSQASRRLFAKTGGWSDAKDYAESPVLSPDGRWIAFRWIVSNPPQTELRIMPNRSGAASVAILATPIAIRTLPRDWQPGNSAVLVEIQSEAGWDLAWVSVQSGAITTIRSFGPSASDPIFTPRVSPDGGRIVYGMAPKTADGRPLAGQVHLFVVGSDGTNLRPLTTTASVNRGPLWTADGSHILFTSNVGGSFDLWAAALPDGSSPAVPVPVLRDIRSQARVLTSEGRFLYAAFPPSFELSFISVTPRSRVEALRVVESIPGTNPAWSPDGTMLLVTRGQPGEDKTLVVRSMRDQNERVYTLDGLRGSPRWADNQTILAMGGPRDGAGTWSVFRIDVANGERREILAPDPTEARTGDAVLSPDGLTLYVGARDARSQAPANFRIVAIDLRNGQKQLIAALPSWPSLIGGGYLGLAIAPDGSALAALLVKSRVLLGLPNEGYVSLIDIHDGTVRDLAGPFLTHSAFGKIAWAKDSIWYAAGATDSADRPGWRVMRIPASGGTPEEVVSFINGSDTFARLAVSPDGSHIAWSPTPGFTQAGSDLAGPRSELWSIDLRQALATAGVTLKR